LRGKWCWILVSLCIVLPSIVAVTMLVVYEATRHRPAFYRRALSVAPQQQKIAGDELERNVLELHNEVRHSGHWQATFSEQQINGWLASDLMEKFPNLLPKGVFDPRVALDPENAQVACRYESPKMSAIISLSLAVHLTDEPNVVAVRIRRARAGALPLPLKNFLDRISRVAAQSGFPLRWAQEDGDPVALFKIPSEHEDYVTQGVFLESVELRDGEIFLAGSSGVTMPAQVASATAAKLNDQR
jgi:hypothetical protein